MSHLWSGSREPDEPDPDAEGFVLAGGQSSRMGRDKAFVDLGGRPLIDHALGMLREAGLAASIAGGCSSLAAYAPLIKEARSDLGPLSGVCVALAAASRDWVVFVPIDLPLLPASLITGLLQHAKTTGMAVTVPSINGFLQTFPAVVKRDVLHVLQQELEAGRSGCFASFEAVAIRREEPLSVVPVEMLVQAGRIAHPGATRGALPATRWFLNVNSERDLHRAEAWLGTPIK